MGIILMSSSHGRLILCLWHRKIATKRTESAYCCVLKSVQNYLWVNFSSQDFIIVSRISAAKAQLLCTFFTKTMVFFQFSVISKVRTKYCIIRRYICIRNYFQQSHWRKNLLWLGSSILTANCFPLCIFLKTHISNK